ncbi:Serine/threonine-protein phosphatase [Echria macrotheca]|uniref:Serine/threonine-protein phosphatase n=1 Tax=Echria macrotheca TaxID=438768 RepID=A0AAJ0BFL1_9PEZI|nr:Serine/threonine-protein phosphatase [Echria macrotheca]
MAMASATGPDARRAKLQQLAAARGVFVPTPVVVTPPTPTAATANDRTVAEEFLKRRRQSENPDKSSRGGIKRAFSNKTWEPKEVFDALNAHVNSGGTPGVADALINILQFNGGNVNVSNVKNKTSLLTRRKSLESMERSRVLQTAVQNRQRDMVAVLVQYADPTTIDDAVGSAIRSGDPVILQMLLERGANLSHPPEMEARDAQNAFRELCIMGGQADLVGLILQSSGRPSTSQLTLGLVDVTRRKNGCAETVLRLSRSTADGNYNNAEALRTAIMNCQINNALAILTGAKPPNPGGKGLEDSFGLVFEHADMSHGDKMILTEALLLAGASGDAISQTLLQACQMQAFDMVELLVTYGVSVEYQDAAALRHAIAKGQTNLVQLLLSDKSSLSPIYASECVGIIPRSVAPEDRHALLTMLLRKGAGGTPLHDALVDAVETCDMQTIELLLTPNFPGGRAISSGDLRSGRGMVYERHHTASVDHKNGLALSIAVRMNHLPMVKRLLSGRPSTGTLDRVFPQVDVLPSADRYLMTEQFLMAGLSGGMVSAALQQAIEEQPPRRDERLISLLLRHNADVNVNDGTGVLSAISIRDLGVLETLLQNRPAQNTIAAAMARAMTVENLGVRYEMVRLLINAGAGREGPEVSAALVGLLRVKPVDIQLAALLLEYGRADANFDDSAPAVEAARDPNPALFDLVLQHGKPQLPSLQRALEVICALPPSPAKIAKTDAALRRSPPREVLNFVLVKEVQTVLETPAERRDLTVIKMLMAAGADVNAHKGATLCDAVKAVNEQVVDLLFTAGPAPMSLATALPQSLNIVDPTQRRKFTKKLLDGGAPGEEANRALIYAIGAHPTDHPLVGILASHAHSSDGEALAFATKAENPEFVALLLERAPRRYSAAVLHSVFQEATKTKNQEKRIEICKTLLQHGVSGHIVSEALLAAASDGDLALGAVLVRHGASVEHQDGQAIVEACAAGSPEVLQMLLDGAEVKPQTITKGFQAATLVGDLKKRAAVFRLLLEKGVNAEAIDAQLVTAAKYGVDGEDLVRLLLEFGANVNYNAGEAIWNATRSAFLGSLKLMLGLDDGRKTNPSTTTLLKALKASRKLSQEPRYQVIEWLFEAGLPATEEIHLALHRAVKDEPDLRLVQLLLKHGASPLHNGCETLIDAAQLLLSDVLEVLLETEIPQKDISWAFRQAFTPETADTWLSEQGYPVAKMLLAKGAEGESLSVALSVAIDAYGTEKDAIARKFADLLIQSKADVSYEDGLVVRKAAQRADSELIELIFQQKPSSRAVSMAFPCLFESELSEEATLQLVSLFTEYHDGEERLDAMYTHGSEPVIFRALAKFPRSQRMLQTLLDAGYYHDQMTTARVMEEVDEEEPVSLLFWALLQPQKKISSTLIELLIARGAKVNYETPISKTTPLMLAIQSRRLDLVGSLILAGAEVDVTDITGNTPMTMATKIGGDLGTSMMSKILAADPSINDGSLHNAARELNLKALEVLINFGHDLDFPSTLHGGRSALGELCLNAAHAGPFSAAQEKLMEKAMTLLIQRGTDLTIQSDGKSVLLLAFHSNDPVTTARALLKVGMWRLVNNPVNHFTDGEYTYSATQYVARVLPESDEKEQLLALLKANRAKDVYYANDGPQPEGAVNLPEELLRAERERRAREERIAKEEEDHKATLARTKEIAQIHDQIFKARAELEDSRARRQREEEMNGIRQRQALEDHAFAAELQRRKAERDAAMRHEQQLVEAGLSRTRLIADAELEMETRKQEKILEWDQKRSIQNVANAKQLSAIRVREREALENMDAANDARTMQRISEHRRLVDGQNALAAQLGSHGVDQRRQIGYVTGEIS